MPEDSKRSDMLLAAILVQLMSGAPGQEKAMKLNAAGLSHAEIATLLNTTPSAVTNLIYEAKSGRRAKRKRR